VQSQAAQRRLSGPRKSIGSRRFKSEAQRKAVFAQLASQHKGLVRKEVNRVIRRNPRASQLGPDLESAGTEALLRFAKRFNPKRAAFSTGATQAIRAGVQREIFRSKTVRVPEKKVRREAARGPLPSAVSLTEVKERATGGGIEQAEARVQISKFMKRLTPVQRTVIKMRMIDDRPIGEVAKRIKVSRPRVRTVERQAMKRLRSFASE
jgi:RNA polymerase sigma factor (sigma-70 family)